MRLSAPRSRGGAHGPVWTAEELAGQADEVGLIRDQIDSARVTRRQSGNRRGSNTGTSARPDPVAWLDLAQDEPVERPADTSIDRGGLAAAHRRRHRRARDLRTPREAEARPASFDLRAFHRALLQDGPGTVPMLRAIIERRNAAQKR